MPSTRFFLLMVGLGGVVGLVMLILEAPFWLFYVAPVLMGPFLLRELRSLDPGDLPLDGRDEPSEASALKSEEPDKAPGTNAETGELLMGITQKATVSNVELDLAGSEATRIVPLAPALLPVPSRAKSPARLMEPHSRVVPFVGREALRGELVQWLEAEAPFAGTMIVGQAGTGKTRLAVELSHHAQQKGWLTGMLTFIDESGSYEALATARIPRLITIDYAEARRDELRALLPLLASKAELAAPIRVLLLARTSSYRTSDLIETSREDLFSSWQMHGLDHSPLNSRERKTLFDAAATAFADRLGSKASPAPPPELEQSPAFSLPLLVLLAAYLAIEEKGAPPVRKDLHRSVLRQEKRYWQSTFDDPLADEDQYLHVVALATLLSAHTQAEAFERLRRLPQFADSSAEQLELMARWAHE